MTWTPVYETDFVNSFTVNDSGRDTSGNPCWLSRFPYGRVVNNGEVGLYSDPALFPSTDPFPIINGKRNLQSQRLASPIRGNNQSETMQDYHYSAALMCAPHLKVGYGMRIEADIALPDAMKKGYWPGFWLLDATPNADGGWPWPPELDIMEHWLYNEGDRIDAFRNNQIGGTAAKTAQDSRSICLSDHAIPGDVTQTLTYAAEFWAGADTGIMIFINGKLVAKRPNPDKNLLWYPILDLAVAGDPWPGAPAADTVFPQRVVLNKLRILKSA